MNDFDNVIRTVMDYAQPGITWQKMTIDEYAALERNDGDSLVCVDGIWWRAIRPLFYRPLIPFTEILPRTAKYPSLHLFGGVQHAVSDLGDSNSVLNYFIYDDLPSYSLDNISRRERYQIKRGLENVVIKPILDLQEFIEQGYPCYLSFYERTQYSYRSDRRKKHRFVKWAHQLFVNTMVQKLGAYREGTIAGILLSYQVENDLYLPTIILDPRYYNLFVSDALIHSIRESAAKAGVHQIYMGMQTGIKGVDEFKLLRGFKLVRQPAYFKLNRLAHYILKNHRIQEYKKLLGYPYNNAPDLGTG